MRVLFFVEPLIMHNRPFHYWAWLGFFARIWRGLEGPERDHQLRVVLNEALALRAVASRDTGIAPAQLGRGLPVDGMVTLAQEEIRRIFDAPNIEILAGIHRQTWSTGQLAAYAHYVRDRLAGFTPDLIFSLTPASFLHEAFPDALILAMESGAMSRAPYPGTVFYDPCGLWDRSIPALHADALFAREPEPAERELLDRLRRHYTPYFEATTPFADLERRLRKRYRRIAFLPLQFGGESGFDINGPFRNQGEYLFHVLERLPEEIAILAVEHPTAIWVGDLIDAETREYLEAHHPRLVLLDFRLADSAGQYLVRHADYVIAVSTSLGLQGMLWGKPLVSIGTSHLDKFASVRGVENLNVATPLEMEPSVERVLAWLMTHYWTPTDLAFDGAWLDAFFARSIERARAGQLGIDFYDPVAPLETLAAALGQPFHVRPARGRPLDRVLENGDLSAWSLGDGPFVASGETCDHWHLVAADGAEIQLSRAPGRDGEVNGGAGAVRMVRSRSGQGPSLFLQRIADLAVCANRIARLSFWARSATRSSIETYFYQQFDRLGVPGLGTDAQRFDLAPEWQCFVYTARIPALKSIGRGKSNHTEVAFALPVEPGPTEVEVAEVQFADGEAR